MKTEIQKQLEEIAFKKTIPFCYSCYKECPTGTCSTCSSDDLMRLLPGNGCEYGIDWVIKALIEENLDPANLEEAFEQSIADCYTETTKVAWMELDTVSILKEMDPISWNMAQSEYEAQEADEGNIISFNGGSTYYWAHEVESFIEKESKTLP